MGVMEGRRRDRTTFKSAKSSLQYVRLRGAVVALAVVAAVAVVAVVTVVLEKKA